MAPSTVDIKFGKGYINEVDLHSQESVVPGVIILQASLQKLCNTNSDPPLHPPTTRADLQHTSMTHQLFLPADCANPYYLSLLLLSGLTCPGRIGYTSLPLTPTSRVPLPGPNSLTVNPSISWSCYQCARIYPPTSHPASCPDH